MLAANPNRLAPVVNILCPSLGVTA